MADQKKDFSIQRSLFSEAHNQFRDGVRLYLKDHAYGNAEEKDFFGAMTKASGVDLDSWTREWLETGKGIDPNMLGAVLGTAAQFGDRALFDSMLAEARKAQDPRIRETLIGALGSFRKPELANAAMNLFLAKTFDVRESFNLLFEPMNHRETSRMPFEFVRAHLDQIVEILPREVGGDFAAGLVEVGNAFCSPEGADEVDSTSRAR